MIETIPATYGKAQVITQVRNTAELASVQNFRLVAEEIGRFAQDYKLSYEQLSDLAERLASVLDQVSEEARICFDDSDFISEALAASV